MKRPLMIVLAVTLAFNASACATKRYGRAVPLTTAEAANYTCREIDIEIAKAQALRQAIASNNPIDGAAMLGYLGDFGIGNAMERRAADKSAGERLAQLQTIRAEKACPAVAAGS